MRVLFDKNVPRGVRKFLDQHQVETVDERGWQRISNGELLQAAEKAGFAILLTADQNIVYQQNLKERSLALIVLGSNIWPIVRRYGKRIAGKVAEARAGDYVFIEMPLTAARGKAEG